MKIEIQIDRSCAEPKVVILTERITEEINELMKRLSERQPVMLVGFCSEQATMLEPCKIVRIYASEGKVYAETEGGTYLLRLRLYEVEQRLAGSSFVRVSNGEIINLKKVKGFDLSLVGTICVSLSIGTITYVSRRYVTKIKQQLGL